MVHVLGYVHVSTPAVGCTYMLPIRVLVMQGWVVAIVGDTMAVILTEPGIGCNRSIIHDG